MSAPFLPIAAASAATLLAAVLLLWLLSLRLRDASIIDIAYGPLVALAGCVAVAAGHYGPLQLALLVPLLAWALRIGFHLGRRNIGHGEDPRYTALRRRSADERAFAWLSLRMVYLHQGAVFWLLALPAQLVAAAPVASSVGWLALGGVALAFAGIAIEWIADRQLAAFRADPANSGQVMDRGLWGWSRHPNYFGEACVHWGLGLIACEAPWGALGLVGPALITFYLIKVTGIPPLERRLLRTRPGYAAYAARTSAFLPLPPRPG